MRYLKKGFSHCFAISVSNGQYVKYESGHGVTRVDCFEDFEHLLKNCIIVKCNGKESSGLFYVNTCVGFVKAIVGITGLSFTPYQLYKKIR